MEKLFFACHNVAYNKTKKEILFNCCEIVPGIFIGDALPLGRSRQFKGEYISYTKILYNGKKERSKMLIFKDWVTS